MVFHLPSEAQEERSHAEESSLLRKLDGVPPGLRSMCHRDTQTHSVVQAMDGPLASHQPCEPWQRNPDPQKWYLIPKLYNLYPPPLY